MNQEKRKAINKLSIECAAVELFSQRSFAAVSMNEIAEAAGLSKRTVYKYFESKDALISSLFEKYQQNHYVEHKSASRLSAAGGCLDHLHPHDF